MSRRIHAVPVCGVLLTLWATACVRSSAQAAGPPGAETMSDGSALPLAPSASLSSSENGEADKGRLSSALQSLEDAMRLDILPPVDSPEGNKWKDYPDRWWIKTPSTLWLPQVNGHVGIKKGSFSKNVPVDVSFRDLTKSLEYAVSLNVEAGHGPIFGGFQGMWMQWKKNDITGPLGVASVDARAYYGLLNGYIGYHFLDLALGGGGDPYPSLGVDGLIGTDWSYLKLKLSPARFNSVQRTVSWFDPYLGLRGRVDLSEHIGIQAFGTAGGFDADHDNFFWNANALVEYRFTPKWSVFAGYQALSQDYESSSFVYKIITHGPIIGLAGRW